ncbi:MAG: 16S rRNA (cytosine(1402)-N(4))-methyltransferase RsmH [Marinilabiliaceae bacterium]|jgi:16S rRNA (cytosine1402-N4)-methyltransferase|nr:16S rRNA (cytosine(1402)-N(4))-methyltransferase RsmH [Marinilabiliaceae bacterium]
MAYHVPALLDECVEGLNIQPSGVYVDLTFGGGGHSKRILEILEDGVLAAFDQDENAERNRPVDDRFLFFNQNFRFLKANLRYAGLEKIDGILADLGVSFYQFDEPERGFSFRYPAQLDMRMNPGSALKASDILNTYEAPQLIKIFRDYGEIKNPGRLAGDIIDWRSREELKDTTSLLKILKRYAQPGKENKFYARVFQALRIEVNREMEFLKEMLMQSLEVLRPGGRMAVITYHSLEDRLVKNFFRTGSFEGHEEKDFYGHSTSPFRLINRKVIMPSKDEIEKNSRARSARLRIAEKI